jgi:hypothetical protein
LLSSRRSECVEEVSTILDTCYPKVSFEPIGTEGKQDQNRVDF